MPSEVATSHVSPFAAELFDSAAPRPLWNVLGWGVAVGAHLLAAGLALTEQQPAPHVPPPLEVELSRPEPPPPPPPPPTAAPEEKPAPVAAVTRPAAAPTPQAARVGALVTAKADPEPSPKADEPVDFTNDPTMVGFGSGVVAVGGKADVGVKGAKPTQAPSSGTGGIGTRPTGDALTPASDLSRKPGLAESDPCRGYFPNGASDDVATASVMVTIGRTGSVSNVRLLSESPAGQGFGGAARTCMSAKRFSPGLDRDGNPTATAIRVNIRFTR